MFRKPIGILLALVIAWPTYALDDTIVVATYKYPGKDREAAILPLSNYIGKVSGIKSITRVYDSPSLLIDALAEGEVDILVPNLAGFLQAHRRKLSFETLVVPDVPKSQANEYRSVFVAKSKFPLNDIEGLKDSVSSIKLALVWKDSMSGGIVLTSKLAELGITHLETDFKLLNYAGSHEKSLQQLLNGEVDIAGLALGAFNSQVANLPDKGKNIKAIWTSPPIPVGPLLCSGQSKLDCRTIAQHLLQAHTANSEVISALNKGWPEFGNAKKLVLPDAKQYSLLLSETN